ncbi:hypothetical protein CsSME_00048949 [Camellia sinensis var. sinensis]
MLSMVENDFNFSVLTLNLMVKLELSEPSKHLPLMAVVCLLRTWPQTSRPVGMATGLLIYIVHIYCIINLNTMLMFTCSIYYLQVIVAMDPGPIDPTATIARMGRPDARIVPYLERVGFYGLIHVSFIQLDWYLITALVERWRSETRTFHLTSGEVTISLQDVNILSGLQVDGNAVTGNTGYDWLAICNRLLGTVPSTNQLKGLRLNMTWLSQTCDNLPIDADDVIIQRYARAFILQLLGGSIVESKSGNMLGCIESYVVHLANVCITFLVFSSLFKSGRGIAFPTLLRVVFLDNQYVMPPK